ncbi:uncharacterized protein CTRU02_211795 [Colletotrichum truncatum]|uniref:Uncharacterized protein n=1 Tax=Colletotrichum truncatum TaxID=5467 RepID=A0ACC3YLW4_COLTU
MYPFIMSFVAATIDQPLILATPKWCDSNMSKSPEKQLVSPPGAAKTEWGLIGSRIPKQTAKGLAKWHEQADKVWLFASCNETSSTTIARAGLEILCIAFTPGPEIRQRVSKL